MRASSVNTEGLLVAGLNSINQISEKSNGMNLNNIQIVCPPLELPIIPDCISYSVYFDHSVMIDNNSAFSKGPNTGNTSNKTQPKKLPKLTKLTLPDKEKNNYSFISAVCGSSYTLYLQQKRKSNTPVLTYFNESLKENDGLIFIDIEEHTPLALFGGRKTAAAIDEQGSVIVITQNTFSAENSSPNIITLPDNERSIFVACLEKTFFILSDKFTVYEYSLTDKEIKEVKELKDKRIISISGTWHHVLAVTDEYQVYGRGENDKGQLCQDPEEKIFNEFVNLTSLENKNIVSVYAGSYHSLFVDSKGKVFSCGKNTNGELLLKKPQPDPIIEPKETMITKGAKFCIAGCQISCVFRSVDPPKNSPNQIVQRFLNDKKSKSKSKPDSVPNDTKIQDLNLDGDLAPVKLRLLTMRKELESKNKLFDLVQDQNLKIMTRLQYLDQKIDQFLESNKLDDNQPDEDDNFEEIPKKQKPQKVKKLTNSKNNDNDDDDEQKVPKNKKQIKQGNIEYDDDFDDNDDDGFKKQSIVNKNPEDDKKTKKPVSAKKKTPVKRTKILDDDDDKSQKITKDKKVTFTARTTATKKKQNKKTKNDSNSDDTKDSNSYSDSDSIEFQPPPKPATNKIVQGKKKKIDNNKDYDDNDDDDHRKAKVKKTTTTKAQPKPKPNNKPKQNLVMFDDDDDDDDIEYFDPKKATNNNAPKKNKIYI